MKCLKREPGWMRTASQRICGTLSGRPQSLRLGFDPLLGRGTGDLARDRVLKLRERGRTMKMR